MEDIINYLAQRNGESQDLFVIEEMAELQKELIKHRRGKENRIKIIEESVDVLLTIDILLKVYCASDNELQNMIKFKLKRLRDFLPREEI